MVCSVYGLLLIEEASSTLMMTDFYHIRGKISDGETYDSLKRT